jgi:hypothetical protein
MPRVPCQQDAESIPPLCRKAASCADLQSRWPQCRKWLIWLARVLTSPSGLKYTKTLYTISSILVYELRSELKLCT